MAGQIWADTKQLEQEQIELVKAWRSPGCLFSCLPLLIPGVLVLSVSQLAWTWVLLPDWRKLGVKSTLTSLKYWRWVTLHTSVDQNGACVITMGLGFKFLIRFCFVTSFCLTRDFPAHLTRLYLCIYQLLFCLISFSTRWTHQITSVTIVLRSVAPLRGQKLHTAARRR